MGHGKPLELRDLPVPAPGPHEALIRIECCTICGSDLHTVSGKRTEATPTILGHEAVGSVCELGDPPPGDVEGVPLRIGDRITWSTSVSCGECDRCRSGLPQKCRTLARYGHEVAEGPYALCGGLSEFLLLRRGSTIVRVPGEIPAEVICPANCATATVAAAIRTGDSPEGRRVLILGAGMLGLTAAAMSRSLGAELVVLSDINPRRLQHTNRFGAHAGVEFTPDENAFRQRLQAACGTAEFDLVLELSGSPDAVEAAVRAGDIGAHVVLIGSVMRSRPVPIDPERVVRRWLTISGVHNYTPADLQTAVRFLEHSGMEYAFSGLVEQSFSLADANAAIETALRTRPVRIAIRP